MNPSSFSASRAQRIHKIVLAAFCLILLRILYLALIEHEEKKQEATKPMHRSIVVKADRGEIYDRFMLPLAVNKICYRAGIDYSQIARIPRRGWRVDASGSRWIYSPRREHIKKLATCLAPILCIKEDRIEDLIHSKAALFPHVPFILKTNLDESQYFRLKMLEKDWEGLHTEIGSERSYPQKKVGCHLIGALGSMSHEKYMEIAEEMFILDDAISSFESLSPFAELPDGYDSLDAVYQRLDILKDKAYTLSDRVGIGGIEKEFEETLRGSWGLAELEVDHQGKPLRELESSKKPVSGNTLILSISAELQQFAEELLIQAEKDLEGKSLALDPIDKLKKVQKQPWIKGGAIVAMDPRNGEILALASHPRFDPSDFTFGSHSTQWLEGESFIQELWDGLSPLTRERAGMSEEETQFVTWDFFLEQLLSKSSALKLFFEKINDVQSAVQMQEDFETLLYFSPSFTPIELLQEIANKKSSTFERLSAQEETKVSLHRLENLCTTLPNPKDRLFAIDLCRLCIYSPLIGDDLLMKIGSLKLATYRSLNQAFSRILQRKKTELFESFHQDVFLPWRKENQQNFLKEKRQNKKRPKPYLDYLDQEEKEQFALFWQEHRFSSILDSLFSETDPDSLQLSTFLQTVPEELQEQFLKTFRSFNQLTLPLLTNTAKYQLEKDLVKAFYPAEGFGFNRSYAFQTCAPQGSIFKLVTAYEALKQHHQLSLIDEFSSTGKAQIVAYSKNRTPYPRLYKGGRLPKSASTSIGEIDLVGAIERSSNPYFSILAGDFFHTPEDLNSAAAEFGFGSKTGIQLPGEAKGSLPRDLTMNRTGLYSYAIGQHTLLNTPLQTALMLAAIANGGELLQPQLVQHSVDPQTGVRSFLSEKTVQHSIDLTPQMQQTLFEGMDRCVWGEKGCARATAILSLVSNPSLMNEYQKLKHQMIGKTSTAEVLYPSGAAPSSPAQIYKHIWFGSIAFSEEHNGVKMTWQHPELVVVVFLRFGNGGKTAAPIAARMIHKWRDIQRLHSEKLTAGRTRIESK